MPKRIIDDTAYRGRYTNSYAWWENRDYLGFSDASHEDLIWGAEGRVGYPNLLGTTHNVGGKFWVKKDHHLSPFSQKIHIRGNYSAYRDHFYEGTISAAPEIPSNLPDAPLGTAWGPEAYSKMKPTRPAFSGLNALYELKDLPGMLRQKFLNTGLAGIGSYHLALKFGWEPLLRDIANLYKLQKELEKRYNQLLRDNGRPVRRRIKLLDVESDPVEWGSASTANQGLTYPSFVDYFYRYPTVRSHSHVTTDRVWASAQFRYWLPEGVRDVKWKRKVIQGIHGLEISPATIYNAIPWSWLIDWFTNVGDVISNIQVDIADRLAADYFYVMREVTSRIDTTTSVGYWSYPFYEPVDLTLKSSFLRRSRSRVKGDPFGGAFAQEDLNGTQLAILGALGLSRLG